MELSFIGKPEGEKFKSIFKSTLYNEKPELNHGSIRVLTGGEAGICKDEHSEDGIARMRGEEGEVRGISSRCR